MKRRRSWQKRHTSQSALLLLAATLAAESYGFSTARFPIRHQPFLSPSQSFPLSVAQSSDVTEIKSTPDHVRLEREISQLGRSGDTDLALQLLFDCPTPTLRQVNAALDACARARPVRLEQAEALLQEFMPGMGLEPNVYTFGALITACARAGQYKRAVYWLRSMQSLYNVEPNAVIYHSAVNACSNARPPKPETALQLLEEAVDIGVPVTVVGFNAAVAAFARAGQWEDAMEIVQQMEMRQDWPDPDAVTYGTLLSACEMGGKWDAVLQSAETLKDRFGLDALAVTSALHACQRLGLAEKAVQYFELLKKKEVVYDRITGDETRLIGPDAVAYRLVISACARGGAWQDGIRFLEEYHNDMQNNQDVVAYTAAITGCEYAGEWKHAFGLLDRMRKRGVEPNEVTFASVFGACANACAKQQDPKEDKPAYHKAMKLLRVLKKDPTVVKPNVPVYNAAIRVCAEAQEIKRAFEILQELQDDGLEATQVTYGSLMTACERVGSMEGVNRVFRLMRDAEMEPNEIIYGAAVSCCRKAGEAERALLLLRKMIRENLKPNVALFNTVLVAHTECKKITTKEVERAILVYKLLRSNQHSLDGPNRQTYNILIKFLALNRQPREAELLLRQMRQDGFFPDVDLFTATITGYERLGQPMKALRLMESMREDGYDFYESSVLNAAFKKAVKLANMVGRSWTEEGLEKGSPGGYDFSSDAVLE